MLKLEKKRDVKKKLRRMRANFVQLFKRKQDSLLYNEEEGIINFLSLKFHHLQHKRVNKRENVLYFYFSCPFESLQCLYFYTLRFT